MNDMNDMSERRNTVKRPYQQDGQWAVEFFSVGGFYPGKHRSWHNSEADANRDFEYRLARGYEIVETVPEPYFTTVAATDDEEAQVENSTQSSPSAFAEFKVGDAVEYIRIPGKITEIRPNGVIVIEHPDSHPIYRFKKSSTVYPNEVASDLKKVEAN